MLEPVRVIVPVFNAERFLREGLESLFGQNVENLEVIVVDDGSTDGSARIAQSFGDKVRYVAQENGGPSKARNTGLRLVDDGIVGFLDADDLWSPNRLKVQLPMLQADPSIDILLGRTLWQWLPTDEDVVRESSTNGEPPAGFTCLGTFIGSALYRRSVFDKVGLYDESLRYSEDVDWFMRAKEQDVNWRVIKEVTLHYRRHRGNMTRQKSIKDLGIMAVLKASLDRRRRQGKGVAQKLVRLDGDEEK